MKEQIIEMLEQICDEDLHDELDVDLFDEGLLDSMGLAEIVVQSEERFGIKLSLTDLNKDDLRTPNMIISFLENH